ncbi:hypothetical protein HNR42_003122 [Deinobacterium chartae]|uniref:Intein C-terminal splicing domain-containing protein n=1 Tax=Deinobacterium chartae TaxID=521158 RepID=A0A841I3P5_9DEIO|nr:hypothetical protein [Deinobacterium chartae]
MKYVNTVSETRTMYNLDVVVADTFFVGTQGWLVHNTSGNLPCRIGFASGEAVDAVTGMNKGGGHAIRHLIKEGLIPNKGSLQSQVDNFSKNIAIPILENPNKTFDYKVGGTMTRAFMGEYMGKPVVIYVAKEGPYAGKVISSIVPDADQLATYATK